MNRILSHNAGLPPELVLPTDPSKVQVPHGMEHLCGVDFTRGGIFTEINEVLVKEGKENIYSGFAPDLPFGPLDVGGGVKLISSKIIDLGNGIEAEFMVMFRYLTVNGVGRFYPEVVVEPRKKELVMKNKAFMGGFGLNTAHYYRGFYPYIASGYRLIFTNLLGGGSEDYGRRDKRTFRPWPTEGQLEEHHIAEAIAHFQAIINDPRYDIDCGGKAIFDLFGESMGGLMVMHALAYGLSREELQKIDAVGLDAPVPMGRLPFGIIHAVRLAIGVAGKGKYISPLFGGTIDSIPPEVMKNTIAPDTCSENEGLANRMSESGFSATGVFPDMALQLKRDHFAHAIGATKPSDDESSAGPVERADWGRSQILRNIRYRYYVRPHDRVIHVRKLLATVLKYNEKGVHDIKVTPHHRFARDHMQVQGYRGLEEYAVNYPDLFPNELGPGAFDQ